MKAKAKAGRLVSRLRPSAGIQQPTLYDADIVVSAAAANKDNYANPRSPHNTSVTAGSVIHELLEAARDGSDLFLPLKAVLVGVVKIWDICDVGSLLFCAQASSDDAVL